MTRKQIWGPFAVLCSLVAVSILVGALLPRYRKVTEFVGCGAMANAIVYAFVIAGRLGP